MINKEIIKILIEIENSLLFLKREWLFYTNENLRRKTFEQAYNFNKGNSLLYSLFNPVPCDHLIGIAFWGNYMIREISLN